MKILVVSSGYPPDVKGGGEHSTKIISEELAARGHEVNVLTLSDHAVSEIINGVHVQRVLSPNVYWNFRPQPSRARKIAWHVLDNVNPRAYWLVKKQLQRINPDVVLTSTIENFGAEAWRACHALKTPVVHVLRSYYVLCYRGTCFKNGQNCTTPCGECQILTLGRRQAAKAVNGLIGISEYILDKHIPAFPGAHAQVIYNPVQTRPATPKTMQGTDIHFGYLGRLEPEKGIEPLLEAFVQLPDTCILHIGGTGNEDYVAYLKKKYPQPNIRFLGWVNARDVYEKIHYLILPAQWHEPFGRVVVEAFSYGVPVIGAMRGGIPELIQEGENGYLFEPSSAGSLQEACRKALQNSMHYSEMSSRAIQSSAYFEKSAIAAKYEEFLTQVVVNFKQDANSDAANLSP